MKIISGSLILNVDAGLTFARSQKLFPEKYVGVLSDAQTGHAETLTGMINVCKYVPNFLMYRLSTIINKLDHRKHFVFNIHSLSIFFHSSIII